MQVAGHKIDYCVDKVGVSLTTTRHNHYISTEDSTRTAVIILIRENLEHSKIIVLNKTCKRQRIRHIRNVIKHDSNSRPHTQSELSLCHPLYVGTET